MENQHLQKLEHVISAFSTDEVNIFYGNKPIFQIQKHGSDDKLRNNLAGFIYSNCYCRDGEIVFREPEVSLSNMADGGFLGKICAANTSTGEISGQWQIAMWMPNGDPVISKGTDAFSISKADLVMNVPPANTPGDNYIAVHNIKELVTDNNSFYYVFSDNPVSKRNGALLRFYWNIKSDGVPSLINMLTSGLNRHYIPFQFKCLKHPALYNRRDACVLYISPRYLHIAYSIIEQISAGIKQFLNADVPMFTLKLRDGLSFAESPAGGQSFGMQHALILSEGLLMAFRKQLHSRQKVDHIISAYQSLGYNLAYPYKNPGSINNYNFLTQPLTDGLY